MDNKLQKSNLMESNLIFVSFVLHNCSAVYVGGCSLAPPICEAASHDSVIKCYYRVRTCSRSTG